MLLHHWKYFVPSNLATARGSSVAAGAQQHFLQLLQTVGACFESEAASPALYGYNLAVRTAVHEDLAGAWCFAAACCLRCHAPVRVLSSIRQAARTCAVKARRRLLILTALFFGRLSGFAGPGSA